MSKLLDLGTRSSEIWCDFVGKETMLRGMTTLKELLLGRNTTLGMEEMQFEIMGSWTSVGGGWYWPCSEKKKVSIEHLKASKYERSRTYPAVQLDEHHETTGNESRHRDQNRIEQKRQLHGIGQGTI